MSNPLIQNAKESAQITELKATNLRLMRQLEHAKAKVEDLVDAVYTAAHDAATNLQLAAVPKPAPTKGSGTSQTAVAVLSDWQLAKITASYNSKVCEERIELYADKVLRLTEIQRAAHPIKTCQVWILGDIIEGELIFPGQASLIDASLYRQVCVDGPRILGNFLRRMLANFDRVEVIGVIGNHGGIGGKSRREHNPTTNADRMLYRICQTMFDSAGEKRITWTIPDRERERDWYAIAKIGDYRCLLFHGDQIRGHSGIPWYGFHKRVLGWRGGAIREPFSEAACGHFHTPTRITLNAVTVRVSGSPESDNTYAQEQLAAIGRPSQWLLFVHPKHGVTAEYCVWLDEGRHA